MQRQSSEWYDVPGTVAREDGSSYLIDELEQNQQQDGIS